MSIVNKNLNGIIKAYGKEPSTMQELFEAIIATINAKRPNMIIGLAFKMEYSPKVSNSHAHPHNGVGNFNRKDDLPLYYPGFEGRIWFRTSRSFDGFSSSLMNEVMVHTGTGGGGGYGGPWENIGTHVYKLRQECFKVDNIHTFSYDCRIFLDDFPAISNNITKQITYDVLNDKQSKIEFWHSWTDEKVLERDKKIKLLYENRHKIPKLIGIVGLIGSGKDTVASRLNSTMRYQVDSFANNLKSAVSVIFNWSFKDLAGTTPESREWRETVQEWWANRLGIPNLTPRWVLQNIGTNVMRKHFSDDIWIASLEQKISKSSNKIVISDCRFPNEIQSIHNMGGVVIRVKRNDPDWVTSGENLSIRSDIHPSEYSWIGCDIDYTIDNSGTLAELHDNIQQMIEYFVLK